METSNDNLRIRSRSRKIKENKKVISKHKKVKENSIEELITMTDEQLIFRPRRNQKPNINESSEVENTTKTSFLRSHSVIILFHVYVLFAFLLYLFGPLEYPDKNLTFVVIFVVLYQLLFILGYVVSHRMRNKIKKVIRFRSLTRIVRVLLLLNLFISVMIIVRHVNSFSPSEIINGIINGFIQPGKAYEQNLKAAARPQIGGSLFTGMQTFLSIFLYVGLALGTYMFADLKKIDKLLYIVTMLFEVFSFTTRGTNSGVFKVGIIISVGLFLRYHKTIFSKKNFAMFLGIILLGGVATGYFLNSTTSRLKLKEIPKTYLRVPVNKDFPAYNISTDFGNTVLIGGSYISQGFNGFSKVFDYPFDSTYGAGSGRFMLVQLGGPLNEKNELWTRTYVYKMAKIWDSRVSWHSIYTWFANDFSIYGVGGVMFVIGLMFGIIKREAAKKNLFAIAIFPLYILMFMFFPANNFVFDNPLLFLPFVCTNFLFLLLYIFRVRVVV